jgi:acyl dehydratase
MPVKEVIPDLVFGPVTRTVLALYAGASGDHNPIHIDSDFARDAGQPDVFAQGMLSFGVLARVVTEWAGQDRLRRFGVRFASMVHVHDTVTCHGHVVERIDHEGRLCLRVAVEAKTQNGHIALSGEAIVEDRDALR